MKFTHGLLIVMFAGLFLVACNEYEIPDMPEVEFISLRDYDVFDYGDTVHIKVDMSAASAMRDASLMIDREYPRSMSVFKQDYPIFNRHFLGK